jgi:hypothetical protein
MPREVLSPRRAKSVYLLTPVVRHVYSDRHGLSRLPNEGTCHSRLLRRVAAEAQRRRIGLRDIYVSPLVRPVAHELPEGYRRLVCASAESLGESRRRGWRFVSDRHHK